MKTLLRFLCGVSLFVALSFAAYSQDKRNERRAAQPAATPQVDSLKEEPPDDGLRYAYEFSQPDFVVSHIVIQHDSLGRGTITFVQRTETPIVEPLQLSSAARTKIFGLWRELRFLDSDENYQAAKNFAHLGTYKLIMGDLKRKRTAEYNWSDNKTVWALTAEYRKAADQAILVFNIKLAREMQPLNAPGLMNELESMVTRNEVSDLQQLIALLTELKTDEHIPLIARNHADRILKKIEK